MALGRSRPPPRGSLLLSSRPPFPPHCFRGANANELGLKSNCFCLKKNNVSESVLSLSKGPESRNRVQRPGAEVGEERELDCDLALGSSSCLLRPGQSCSHLRSRAPFLRSPRRQAWPRSQAGARGLGAAWGRDGGEARSGGDEDPRDRCPRRCGKPGDCRAVREREGGERRRCHLSPLSLLPDVRLGVARSDQPDRSLIQLLDQGPVRRDQTTESGRGCRRSL